MPKHFMGPEGGGVWIDGRVALLPAFLSFPMLSSQFKFTAKRYSTPAAVAAAAAAAANCRYGLLSVAHSLNADEINDQTAEWQ